MSGSLKKTTGRDGQPRRQARLDAGMDPKTGKRLQPLRTFRIKAEAQQWLNEQASARANGTFADAGKLTVGTYLTEWLKGRKDIRTSSRMSYAALLKSRIIPHLGTLTMRAIRARDVTRFLSTQDVAPRTARVLRAILSKAFEDARREGLLAANPARGLASLATPERTVQAIKYWDRGQVKAFLEATPDDEHAMLWRLMLASGLRIGEALALRWSEVNLKTGTIQVRRTLSRVVNGYVSAEPKTKAGRRAIPLNGTTAAALRAHRQAIRERSMLHRDIWVEGDLVFPRADGSAYAPYSLRTALADRCARHKVPAIGLHGLRHTHATLLLAAGIAPKIVSERLGHTTVAMTLDTYSHVTGAMQEQAAQAIGTALG